MENQPYPPFKAYKEQPRASFTAARKKRPCRPLRDLAKDLSGLANYPTLTLRVPSDILFLTWYYRDAEGGWGGYDGHHNACGVRKDRGLFNYDTFLSDWANVGGGVSQVRIN